MATVESKIRALKAQESAAISKLSRETRRILEEIENEVKESQKSEICGQECTTGKPCKRRVQMVCKETGARACASHIDKASWKQQCAKICDHQLNAAMDIHKQELAAARSKYAKALRKQQDHCKSIVSEMKRKIASGPK